MNRLKSSIMARTRSYADMEDTVEVRYLDLHMNTRAK